MKYLNCYMVILITIIVIIIIIAVNKHENFSNDSRPKIIDCFIFNNEFDMLNYRLNVLDEYVDYFILVESTHTHPGKPKKLFFNDNKDKFSKFSNKLIHVIVDDFKYIHPNVDFKKREQWKNEQHQRNSITKGFDRINLQDDDIIILSDLDEIINPILLDKLKLDRISTPVMDYYIYNLRTKIPNEWTYAKLMTYGQYKKSGSTLSQIRLASHHPQIKGGGWHLSYFGDAEFVQHKFRDGTHQESNIPKFTNIDKIRERIKKGQDTIDRASWKPTIIPIKQNNNLPPKYDIYLKEYL